MNIIQLEAEEKKLKIAVKYISDEIKLVTVNLQNDLRDTKKMLKDVKDSVNELNRSEMNDKNIHILKRFKLWYDSNNKGKSDWHLDNGPMRDHVFIDEFRYDTVQVEDRLWDWLNCIGSNIEGIDRDFEIDVDEIDDEILKSFDKLSEDAIKLVTDVLEDAIKQNVSEYKNDW